MTSTAPHAQHATAQPTADLPSATILGYPRIGPRRELKRAVESFWRGAIDEAELRRTAAELRFRARARLVELGLPAEGGAVPESFSFYDQVLDATLALGAIPARFADVVAGNGGAAASDLTVYFALARGDAAHQPLEMTKWFDTNYHYSVPEIDERTPFVANPAAIVSQFIEAKDQGIETRPVIVGPVTYLLLAKASDDAGEGFAPIDRLDDVLVAYAGLLEALAAAGARWVQLDEPALVSDSLQVPRAQVLELVERAYGVLGGASAVQGARPRILLTAPYGDSSSALLRLAALPIEALHADLVRGALPTGALESGDLPRALAGKQLVAGVIDGRNIWRTDLRAASGLVHDLQRAGIVTVVGTSNNLQHVPHDVHDETKLDARLKSWLAFADQKVEQVGILAHGLERGAEAIEVELAETDRVLRIALPHPVCASTPCATGCRPFRRGIAGGRPRRIAATRSTRSASRDSPRPPSDPSPRPPRSGTPVPHSAAERSSARPTTGSCVPRSSA